MLLFFIFARLRSSDVNKNFCQNQHQDFSKAKIKDRDFSAASLRQVFQLQHKTAKYNP